MLEVFLDEFYGWRYTKFSKLDQYIRRAFKKTFMTKRVYIDKPNGYVSQRLTNFIINNQILVWDKNNFYKYRKMYLTSKA